VIAGMLVRD